MGPDRPILKNIAFLTRSLSWGPVQGRFVQHSLFKQSATAKNAKFSLDGYNRFMKPSWVRAHGLISMKYHIVWVRAPRYRRISSPKGRIRENSALKFGPNFVTLSGGILVVFSNSVHPVESNLIIVKTRQHLKGLSRHAADLRKILFDIFLCLSF